MSRTMPFSDKLLYTIEEINGNKLIHILGEIYCIGGDEEKDYRLAEFTGVYLEFSDVQKHTTDLMDYIYDSSGQVYEKDMNKVEADNCFKTYFGGKKGTAFSIFGCSKNVPCGDYWC